MRKFGWVLLNIFSFGIPYFYAKHQAKKNSGITNTQLLVSTKIDFDIEKLIEALGGKSNILDVSATISTLKVNVKDVTTLSKDSFTKFKINGFMKNANQVILVFGDNAQAISELLITKIKN